MAVRRDTAGSPIRRTEISAEYAFQGSVDGLGVAALVVRERRARMMCASGVPHRLMALLHELGVDQSDVVMKSDGEAAIEVVIDDLVGLRPMAKTIREEAPYGSSANIGIVERAVQSVTHQLKFMKVWVEENWGRKIPDEHPVV